MHTGHKVSTHRSQSQYTQVTQIWDITIQSQNNPQDTTSGRSEVAQVAEGSSSSSITVSLETTRTRPSTGKSASKPHAYIRKFSVYYRVRLNRCGSIMKEMVTKCAFLRFLGLGFGTPRLPQTKAAERSIGMDCEFG